MRSFSKLIFPLVAVAALVAGGPAAAQQKLKWAHVYETNEPYQIVQVDRQSFIDAVLKSATPESLGFTKADYDRIVAIK